MTAALLTIDRLHRSLADAGSERERAAIERSRSMLAAAVERTRRLIFEVRPPLLEAHGLESALRELAEQAGDEGGFKVTVKAAVDRYPFVVEDMAYRIVREAVVNARKHAQARHLEIELADADGLLHGCVRDDGRGFDPTSQNGSPAGHFGLVGMRERAEQMGGRLSVNSRPGEGTEVVLSVPIEA